MADTSPRWITISGSTPGPASPKLRAMRVFGKLGGIGDLSPPEILQIQAVVLLSEVPEGEAWREVAIYLPTLPGSIVKFRRFFGAVDWLIQAEADRSNGAVTTTVHGSLMLMSLFIRHPLLPDNSIALRLDATYSGIASREFVLSNFAISMAPTDTADTPVRSGDFFAPRIPVNETRLFSKVLEQEFLRSLGASDAGQYQTTLPRLLKLPQLTPREPQLESTTSNVGFSWRLRFKEQIEQKSPAAGAPHVYALVLDYHQNRWPLSEEAAVRLWPLGVALLPRGGEDVESAEIELSLRPPDWIRSGTGIVPQEQPYRMRVVWKPESGTVPKGATYSPLMAWNRRVAAPYLEALAQVKGGSPGSLVPMFRVGADGDEEEPQGQLWELRYLLVDSLIHDRDVKPSHFRFEFRELVFTAPQKMTVTAELPNFLAQDRKVPSGSAPLRLRIELSPAVGQSAPDALEEDSAQRSAEIRLFARDLGEAAAQTVRIGSLGLELGAVEMPELLELGSQHISATARHEVTARLLEQRNLPPRVESVPLGPVSMALDLSLGVASFGPGGQDRTAQESGGERSQDRRASKPLLIPLSATSRSRSDHGGKDAPYLLVARESCEKGSTQSLSLRIERAGKKETPDTGSDAQETDLVVLDQQPLLIARVRCKLGLGESRELGNWSGEGAEGSHWELPNNEGSFKLILPPQGLGETFLKDYGSSLRNRMSPHDGDGNPRPLRYYLSPSAELTLARSAHEQNFSEVPWNLRRLLGHPEQQFPGAITQALSFELMYGLSAQLQAGSQMLLLAEIGARLGNLPQPLLELRGRESELTPAGRARSVYSRYRQSAEGIVSGVAGRLGMLQLWTPGLRQWDAEFVQGVSFRFRSTRHVAHPIHPEQGGQYDEDNRFDPEKGLQGGADWGFTQENVHREVVQSGASSSGRLSQLAFTALGGSGNQSAGFAKDKSFLQTKTALGRTFYYSIVRVGRIGMLWNPARHVIVYERTVLDSEQFPDERQKWRGLPVLRKVREYIEILQRERGYPDFGDPELTRGFVRGAAFPNPIIPVDSAAWGYDIPGGSVIPLYKPGAGRLYSEPDVRLKLETAARSGDQVVSARITNPEILLFYTSTNPNDGADTDTWAPLAGVDYPAAPLPVSPDVRPVLPEDPDATLPDPADCEPGYERFCLRVALDGRAVNLMAGRSAAPQEATLQTVSMVRRSLRRGGSASRLGTEFSRTLQDLGPLLDRVVGDTLTSLSRDSVDRLAAEIKSGQAQVQAAWQTLTGSCEDAFALLVSAFQEKQQAWLQALDACLEPASRSVMTRQALLRDLDDLVGSAPNLLSEIRRRRTSLLAALSTRAGEFSALAARLQETLGQALAAVVAAASSLPSRMQYARVMFHAIEDLIARIRGTLAELLGAAASPDLTWLSTGVAELIGQLLPARVLLSSATAPLTAAEASALAAAAAASGFWSRLREYLSPSSNGSPFRLWQALESGDWEALLNRPVLELKAGIKEWNRTVSDAALDLGRLRTKARETVAAVGERQLEFLRKQGALYQKISGAIQDQVADFVRGALHAAVASLSQMEAVAQAEALELCQKLGRQAAQLSVAVGRRYSEQLGVPDGLGDRVLRLAFAHGMAPVADALKLNRDRLTYYFHEAVGELGWAEKVGVSFTPATALVNRMGNQLDQLALKSLSARLPTAELMQEFLPLDPSRLLKFDPQGILTQLRSLLPDFAGLNLVSLLGDLKLPELNSKNVRVTTGFNRAKRQPFVDILINVKLADAVTLLDMAGLTLRLEGAELHAHAHVAIDQSGAQKQEVEASIQANWSLRFGGEPLLTLSEAELRFSEGRVAFRIAPGKIQLSAALQFITDLLSKLQPSGDSGLALELVPGAGSLPIGARARLDVALPALQSGAFSISNIALGVLFELAVAPDDGFYIKTGLSLSSKECPFNLSVLCLGGGGWVSLALGYRPLAQRDKLSLSFSVGITAGACLPFDIGVASGAVYILLYLEVEYSLPESSGGFSLALGLLIGGEVNILSILSISISLRLEGRYQKGVVTGSGRLKVKIKVCAFFKISIDKSFTLTLAGKSSGRIEDFHSLSFSSDLAAAALSDPIGDYLDTFGDWDVA